MKIFRVWSWIAAFVFVPFHMGFTEDLLFEDNFNNGLDAKWQLIGLDEDDYRIRDGGLELRVQPGIKGRETPRLQVDLPFQATDTVVASVKITILDKLTNEGEFAGLMLTDADGWAFSVRKQVVDGELVFDPGKYVFLGKDGEEGDPEKYSEKHTLAKPEAGSVRIIVDRGYAHFQVGPGKDKKYLNFFHSAIDEKEQQHGFALFAANAKEGEEHWVRFENFRVEYR